MFLALSQLDYVLHLDTLYRLHHSYSRLSCIVLALQALLKERV